MRNIFVWAVPGLVLCLLADASRGQAKDQRVKMLFESMRAAKYSENEFPRLMLSDVLLCSNMWTAPRR